IGYDAAQKKFSLVKACSLCGTISSGLVSCDSSGARFECVKEECCPLTSQKIKGRDELVIESNDRIVLNIYKTINDREVKVGGMFSIRQKYPYPHADRRALGLVCPRPDSLKIRLFKPSFNRVFSQQLDHHLPTVAEGTPHRDAPRVNRLVTLRSCRSSKHI